MSTYSIYKTQRGYRKYLAYYDSMLQRWPVPHESVFVDSSFGRSHLIRFGDPGKPVLLLLHGGGTNALMWAPIAMQLSKDYLAYALDNPDQPNRSVGTKPFLRIEDCMTFLEEVVRALGVSRPFVTGLSQGGWLSLNLALAKPDLVAKVACLAPVFGLLVPSSTLLRSTLMVAVLPTRRRVAKYLDRYTSTTPAQRGDFYDDYVEMVYRMLRCYRMPRTMMKHPLLSDQQLRSISCPLSLVVGENEIIYDPVQAIDRARSNVLGVHTALIAGAGHALQYDKPDEVSEALHRFFSGEE